MRPPRHQPSRGSIEKCTVSYRNETNTTGTGRAFAGGGLLNVCRAIKGIRPRKEKGRAPKKERFRWKWMDWAETPG